MAIDSILVYRNNGLNLIAEICSTHHQVDPNALAVITEEELRAQLEVRIVRPKNMPIPDD
jgi:hypothetical protein